MEKKNTLKEMKIIIEKCLLHWMEQGTNIELWELENTQHKEDLEATIQAQNFIGWDSMLKGQIAQNLGDVQTSTYSRGFVDSPLGRHGSLVKFGILATFGLLAFSSDLLVMSSRGCDLGSSLLWMNAVAMPALISMAEQNAGGEFTHPMGRTKGKATRGSPPSLPDWKDHPQFWYVIDF